MSEPLVDNEELQRDMKATLGALINELSEMFPNVSFACTLVMAQAIDGMVHGREITAHRDTATDDALNSFATGLMRAANALASEIGDKGQRSKGLH